MIESSKISFAFIKKLEYTGSDQGMRYMLKKAVLKKKDEQENETEETVLRAYVWPEPFAFAKTAPEKITEKDFPFDAAGKEDAVKWLNEMYEKGFRA